MNPPTEPRTLPVRRWVIILVAGLFLAPILAFFVIGILLFAPNEGPVSEVDQAVTRLTENQEQWSNPSWQTETLNWLHDQNMDVVLMDGDNVVWQSSQELIRSETRTVRQVEVEGAESFILYASGDEGPPQELRTILVPIAVLIALAIAAGIIAWFLRRSIVEPLTATSQAAQELAEGSYDIEIPQSHVREVNDLAASFLAMRDNLHASLERQTEIEKERRFLISAVAHDLRTPLFALRGSLEGIIQGIANTDEKRNQYLQIALRRADDLEKLISDLFAWTRLDLSGLELEKSPLHLDTLLQAAVEGIQPRADAHTITINFSCDRLTVSADPGLLRRAIDNVLDNALTHTPDGGTIDITARQDGQRIWMEIRDSGTGILEDDLERIFAPLYRGEESRNRHTGGAGLGLSVARRIMEAHSGGIRARNHSGGGAAFEFWLPT